MAVAAHLHWSPQKLSKLAGSPLGADPTAVQDLEPLWDELFPAEQARIVQLLVERIDVSERGFDLRLRVDGLAHLARNLSESAMDTRKAA